MKQRVLMCACAVALLPLAAGAQSRTSGFAHTAAVPGEHTITVQGRAVVRYAVTSVDFAATARGNTDDAAVIAAMRAAGIDDPTVGPYGSQVGQGTPALVRGTVHDVTHAKLERIAAAAAEYLRAHPGVHVDNIAFSPAPSACAPHEAEVRAAALADARRKADSIAALTGLVVDGVASVSEFGSVCPVPDGPFQGPSAGAVDLGALTSSATASEQVTFTASPRR